MTRNQSLLMVLASLLFVNCGGGGRQYWLYPEPHLAPPEEAIFMAYESHRVMAIDGDDTASLCWGQTVNEPQGYRRNDQVCHLHLQPGRHTVVFEGGTALRSRTTVEFTAEAGKVYGLDLSACTTPAGTFQQRCRVNVVEREGSGDA